MKGLLARGARMRKPGRMGRNERKYLILSYARECGERGFKTYNVALTYGMTYNGAHHKIRDYRGFGYLKETKRGHYKITDHGLEWLAWYESELKKKASGG